MKKWLIAGIILVVLIGTGIGAVLAISGQTDEQAIKDTIYSFYKAYNDQNFGDCLDYIKSSLAKEQLLTLFQTSRATAGRVQIQEITVSDIKADSAVATVLDQMGESTVTVLKVNGRWKIAMLPQTPSEVVEAFWTAVREERYYDAEEYLSSSYLAELRTDLPPPRLKTIMLYEGIRPEFLFVEIKSEEIQNNKAKVGYTAHASGPTIWATLIQEQGFWKIENWFAN